MTLRVDATRDGPRVAFRLAGRIRASDLTNLERQIASGGAAVVLDLEEVWLVDVVVVRFLSDAEAAGAELRHCPPFIRAWIERECAS